MDESNWVNTLDCVRDVRRNSPFKKIRDRILSGEPYVISNLDDIEEICLAMGIPVVAINAWNVEIMKLGKDEYFSGLLEDAGYPGPHLGEMGYPQYFVLGFGASFDPESAPHGGLPKPLAIIPGGKAEAETRVCELWARQVGAPVFPLDFMFSAQVELQPWTGVMDLKTNWDRYVDPARLSLRVEQEKQFLAFVERETGRTVSYDQLVEYMEQTNEQMSLWHEVQELIATTVPTPVSAHDAFDMYAATVPMRGTAEGLAMTQSYLDEVRDRVKHEVPAHPNEQFRLYYEGFYPPWDEEIVRKYGAVTVATPFTGIAEQYMRDVKDGDPFPAIASRHLFLFDSGPERLLDIVRWCQCDAVIVTEVDRHPDYPSWEQRIIEDAGIPYLAIPRATADDEIVTMISDFIEKSLVRK